MTWQAASFLVLGLALFAGFAWYERSRPPAKVVALVAALAALAIVGRIAFAPIPNVKPTTDIVLLAGYALGGAPGFCVGAVTALVSNFFFLQGPWTPWQMVAWGGVGAAGGALAWLARGRELGRVPLALACGVAGIGFGAVMDLHVWVLGAEQTLASYLAVAGTSLPYNLAHVIANVGFCLLIGPPLVRALRRYRRRTEARWPAGAPADGDVPGRLGARPAHLAALAAAVLAATALAAPASAEAAGQGKAASYLARAQNGDGGFGGDPGAPSNQLHTGWAALGLAAAGRNPRDVAAGGRTVIDYIRRGVGSDTGSLSRTILALAASGVSPRSFGGRDLVSELKAHRRRDGSYDGLVNQTSFAVLALEAAGAGSPGSVRWLKRRQNPNGGYGFNADDGSPEDTGYVLQALVATGERNSRTTRRAAAYVEERQRSNGGFAGDGTDVNAQATAFAVQGLLAAGRSGREVRRGLAYLRSLQGGNGSVRYARGDARTPVWVTSQALLALGREPFPIAAVPRAPGRGSPGAGRGAGGVGGGGPASGGGGGVSSAGAGSAGGSGGAGGGTNADDRREEGAGERRAGSGGPGGGGRVPSLIDGTSEPDDAAMLELAKGGVTLGARSRGSVAGGVIAAASSAALIVGVRRRLRGSLAGERGGETQVGAE